MHYPETPYLSLDCFFFSVSGLSGTLRNKALRNLGFKLQTKMHLKSWVSVLSFLLVFPSLKWLFMQDPNQLRIVSQDKNISLDFDTWHTLSDARFFFNAYIDDRQVQFRDTKVVRINNGD